MFGFGPTPSPAQPPRVSTTDLPNGTGWLSSVVVGQHDLGFGAARRGVLHLGGGDPHLALVKFLEAGLVNAGHLHGARTDVLLAQDQIQRDLVACVHVEGACQRLSNQHVPWTLGGRLGQAPPKQPAFNAVQDRGAVDPSHDHTLQGLRRFQDACPLVAQGDLNHSGNSSKAVEHAWGPHHAVGRRVAWRHLDVAVEPHDQLLDFMLEALHDGRGQDHECHPQRDPCRGDANHRPGAQVAVAAGHAFGQDSFHAHNLKGKGLEGRSAWGRALLLDA